MAIKKILKNKGRFSIVKTSVDEEGNSSDVMEKLLSQYQGTPFALKRGVRVKGVVVAKEPKKLVIDIGGKGEGIVAEKAYQESREYIKTLNVGDEIEAMVIVGETPDGYTILSLRNAMQDAVWAKLEAVKKSKLPVNVLVKSISQSGLTVDVEGQYGFIPTTQIGKELSADINNLTGKRIMAIVIDLERRDNKIVLSEKEVSEASNIKLVAKAMEKIKENEVYDGKVIVVTNFGAFVAVEVKIGKDMIPVEGLVHISEISWGKTENIKGILREGDTIVVKVIGKKDGRLSLSMKQAKSDPWSAVVKKYKKDEKYSGVVTKVSDYGVFVALEEGVEGLIHITKIPPGMNLKVKDSINVIVEEIDANNRKISLAMVLTAKPVGYK